MRQVKGGCFGLLSPSQVVQAITRRYLAGPVMYFAATVLAFVRVPLSLSIIIGLAVLFLLPYRSPTAE